ncbi:MAG: guanylate kinase [Chloroflexi bacterium]|nr:guanylate kinase [Chloroflexota bacterium]
MASQVEEFRIQLLQPSPLLVVLSGPSGVGKDAVIKRMKKKGYWLHYAVTVTTRGKRIEEQDGLDYYFTSTERFRSMIQAGELLEWAEVYGNYYGVPRAQIREALECGRDVILKIDVQGAATVKKLVPDAVFIFLLPPSFEELKKRLVQRHTESPVDLERRLDTAAAEMKSLELFDYATVNESDELDGVADRVMAIVTAEKCRIKRRTIKV